MTFCTESYTELQRPTPGLPGKQGIQEGPLSSSVWRELPERPQDPYVMRLCFQSLCEELGLLFLGLIPASVCLNQPWAWCWALHFFSRCPSS